MKRLIEQLIGEVTNENDYNDSYEAPVPKAWGCFQGRDSQ